MRVVRSLLTSVVSHEVDSACRILLTSVVSHEVGSPYRILPFHLDGGTVSGVAALRTIRVGIVLKKRERNNYQSIVNYLLIINNGSTRISLRF